MSSPKWLDELGTVLSPYLGFPLLVLGNFSARSHIWDLATPMTEMTYWRSGFSLSLLNSSHTSVANPLLEFHPSLH